MKKMYASFTILAAIVIGAFVVTIILLHSSSNNASPVITLIGANPIAISIGSTYIDAGARAFDSHDKNLTSSIVIINPVNTTVSGNYTVTYDVTDSRGNSAKVTRTVNVVDTTKRPIISMSNSTPMPSSNTTTTSLPTTTITTLAGFDK